MGSNAGTIEEHDGLSQLSVESPTAKCNRFMEHFKPLVPIDESHVRQKPCANSTKINRLKSYLGLLWMAKAVKKDAQNKKCNERNNEMATNVASIQNIEQGNTDPSSFSREINDEGYSTQPFHESSNVRKGGRTKVEKRKSANKDVNNTDSPQNNKENVILTEAEPGVEETKKPPRSRKKPESSKNKEGVNSPARRKSLRLSSHPPGYFQTKPAMVIYIEPFSNCKKATKIKKRTHKSLPNSVNVESFPPLRYSLPIVKRRKLHNPNADENCDFRI